MLKNIESYIILGMYLLLASFAIISMSDPDWLQKISQPGRATEAKTYSDEANKLMYQGRFAEAIPFYRQALEIDSTNKNTYGNIATAQIKLGEYQQAAKNLDKMYRLLQDQDSLVLYLFNISMGDLLKGIGNTKQQQGAKSMREFKSALYYYDKAIALMPYDPIVYYRYAHLAWLIGLDSLSIQYYKQGIERNTDLESFYYKALYAEYLIALNHEKHKIAGEINQLLMNGKAIPWNRYDTLIMKDSWQSDNYLGQAYAYLGELLMRAGEDASARELFDRSISINPGLLTFINKIDTAARLDE
ncbi:MAG: tetratricopeptide repeat protein [Bacteroidales bacterium]|nr:tetratricopeptide repeat protein [Bacteroidales bacterium]